METIKSCKATHGKYDIDTGNIVMQVDVELDTKEITKNIAIEVENFIAEAPEVKQQRDELLEQLKIHCKQCIKRQQQQFRGSLSVNLCKDCKTRKIVSKIEGAD